MVGAREQRRTASSTVARCGRRPGRASTRKQHQREYALHAVGVGGSSRRRVELLAISRYSRGNRPGPGPMGSCNPCSPLRRILDCRPGGWRLRDRSPSRLGSAGVCARSADRRAPAWHHDVPATGERGATGNALTLSTPEQFLDGCHCAWLPRRGAGRSPGESTSAGLGGVFRRSHAKWRGASTELWPSAGT
jgi:hypothetical protein